MSWFTLGVIEKEDRKKIKGIWIRAKRGSNPDVDDAIKNSGNLRMAERVWKIEIVELRKNNQVLLEVWAQSGIDMMRRKDRHNVFHLLVDQNPEWCCEGDLGKGSKNLFK